MPNNGPPETKIGTTAKNTSRDRLDSASREQVDCMTGVLAETAVARKGFLVVIFASPSNPFSSSLQPLPSSRIPTFPGIIT